MNDGRSGHLYRMDDTMCTKYLLLDPKYELMGDSIRKSTSTDTLTSVVVSPNTIKHCISVKP